RGEHPTELAPVRNAECGMRNQTPSRCLRLWNPHSAFRIPHCHQIALSRWLGTGDSSAAVPLSTLAGPKSLSTTAPAPITLSGPTVTPSRIVLFTPTKQ